MSFLSGFICGVAFTIAISIVVLRFIVIREPSAGPAEEWEE